ncbi:uncharacterized protein LOC127733297 [Mytilus californianus]|uniref:uncharacterized protein LOC127733297 n=1 Tax=Mytilus californianus TaxID=6549 RepID=UPI002246FA00|nr:uncharacterized protein LOC127733297 [Mytilus californianus]
MRTMASSSKVLCGVCESQHTTTNAEYWCPECDEGLCSQCLKYHNASKASRNHDVISVDDYKQLPSSIANISQHCSQHDRKFQMYCPQHESLCCPLCIQSNHAACVGILSLENVIQTAKTSVLFERLDHNLKDIKMNAERVVKDRKQNIAEIQKQRHKIHDEIKQVRNNINEHLDSLEQRILQDLYAAETKIKTQIEDILGKLVVNMEKVGLLQTNMSAIKEYASDLQAFLGSKMIETEIQKHEIFIQSLFDDGSLQKIVITCKIEDEITNVLSKVTSLGSISLESSPTLVVLQTVREKQAQLGYFQNAQLTTINGLQISLQRKLKSTGATGCSISLTGDIALIDNQKSRLLILKEDGTLKIEISLTTKTPADGTFIDEKTVAVSFPISKQIQIINITTKTVECTIKTTDSCYGVCYRDGELIYCNVGKGIQRVNVSGNCTSLLVKEDTMSCWSYVVTYGDRIFYTNYSKHTIACLKITGEKIWECLNESICKPQGISVDKDYNVYIASYGNNSLFVLSADGNQSRKLGDHRDGIDLPYGLAFDRKKEKLTLTNNRGYILFYNLS